MTTHLLVGIFVGPTVVAVMVGYSWLLARMSDVARKPEGDDV